MMQAKIIICLKEIMLKFTFVLILFFVGSALRAQNKNNCIFNENSLDSLELEAIEKKFKKISLNGNKYREQILIALKYYPELRETRIVFRNKKIKTTMACRPNFFSFFKPHKKRLYIIIISNKENRKEKGVLLKEVPFNAQIGVIGHELAHVADYGSKNMGELIKFGIDYLSKDKKRIIEHKTDSITIAHGLGWQLYDFSKFIITESKASVSYKNYKKDIYYSHNEILDIMKKMPSLYKTLR